MRTAATRTAATRTVAARTVAALGGLLGGAALVLQFALTLDLMGGALLEGVWRFFGYFTIIANTFAVFVLARAALGRGNARGEFAAATTMILVGIVYSLLLRGTWNPQGWQKVADVALHDAMPLVTLAFWLLRPHGRLGPRDVAASLILPLGYLAYGMMRGAFDGWYAYGFMDVAALSAGAVALNCAAMGLAFLVMSALLATLDRTLP